MNNKKDIYRTYTIWTALILFYMVFYYISNYAWIEKMDYTATDSTFTSHLQPIPVQSSDTDTPDNQDLNTVKDTTIHPQRVYENSYDKSKPPPQNRIKYSKNIININTADQQEWESLYNIGPFRAEKIINFRKALGGFYSINQVGETYGVPDSVFQQIKPQLRMDSIVQKIDINQILYDSLYHHPYVTKQMAYFIVKYREEVKPFEKMDELYDLIKEKDHERIQKLEPYLIFGIK